MFTTKQALSALLALQAIIFVAAQSTAVATPNLAANVSSAVDDYVNENRRLYNATLKGFSDQINDINKSLEDQLKALEKQKDTLLNTIRETNEKFVPMETLSVATKYCVQQYKSEFPYADIVKANIESCLASARSSLPSMVVQLNTYYTNLNQYFNVDFKNAIAACAKSWTNPSTNYTLCVTRAISSANQNTISYRNAFAIAAQQSTCSLNARIDATVSCYNLYSNSALTSIGGASRLIDDCVTNYFSGTPVQQCPATCTNVISLAVTDVTFQNATITNPLRGSSKSQGCVEIRYV